MGKYWSRNQSLRTIDFTGNRVTDRAIIDAMQPYPAHGHSIVANSSSAIYVPGAKSLLYIKVSKSVLYNLHSVKKCIV